MLNAQNESEFDLLDGLPPELNKALKEELRYRVMQQAIIAGQEQRQAMAELDADPMCHSEYGTQRVMVHPFFIAYWNDRKPGCWQDPEFVNEFIRDNECVRVKCQSRKVTISFAGMNVRALTAAASGLGPADGKLFSSEATENTEGVILDKTGEVVAPKSESQNPAPNPAKLEVLHD